MGKTYRKGGSSRESAYRKLTANVEHSKAVKQIDRERSNRERKRAWIVTND